MKRVIITLTLECPDDLPVHVLDWMAGNLTEYAEREFRLHYDPQCVEPPFEGPPLARDGDVAVDVTAIEDMTVVKK
jgi:hypothetical protein